MGQVGVYIVPTEAILNLLSNKTNSHYLDLCSQNSDYFLWEVSTMLKVHEFPRSSPITPQVEFLLTKERHAIVEPF
jgi:hypothetical protein